MGKFGILNKTLQISSALQMQIEPRGPFERTSQPGQNIFRFMYSMTLMYAPFKIIINIEVTLI